MSHHSNLRGIASMVFAAGAFVANDTCMKLALADTPPLLVLTLRGISATLWCLPLVFILGLQRHLGSVFNPWVLLRSFSEVVAILCFIFALDHMPIADITAISQITPLIVMAGAVFFFGDHINGLRWLLIGLGIVGAVLVAQPGSTAASPFAFFGFATALGAAFRDIISRKVPAHVPGLIVALSTILCVMSAAMVSGLIFETWTLPGSHVYWLMAAAGVLLMCGHLFVFLAFRLAPARAVAPFGYSFTVWAVISGLVVFREVPNALAIAGMALILLAGLAVILLEGRTRTGDREVTKA